jgi:glutathionyl-hydroquinone reductase
MGLVDYLTGVQDFTDNEIAHRTLIVRKLKGLEEIIPFTSVHWEMLEKGKGNMEESGAQTDCSKDGGLRRRARRSREKQ